MAGLYCLQQRVCTGYLLGGWTVCGGIGAGLAQIPGSDNAIVVPIQIAMIISLGAVFGVKLTESAATSASGSATATLVGRGLSQALVGWIPVIGNAINAVTAAGVTEAIGWAVVASFDRDRRKA